MKSIRLIVAAIALLATFAVSASAFGADTKWDTPPELTYPGESPKLYVIVNSRGARSAGIGFRPGVLAATGYSSTAALKPMESATTDLDGALWYVVPGKSNGSVMLANADYPDAYLTHNPAHTLEKPSSVGPLYSEWYLLPNSYNSEGLTISSTSTLTWQGCLDGSDEGLGGGPRFTCPEGYCPLSAGWQPQVTDWQGTTWMFVPVEADAPFSDVKDSILLAYYKRSPEDGKQIFYHSMVFDTGVKDFVTIPPASYETPGGRFSTSRMQLTKNVAFFWEAEFGDDPTTAPDNLRMPMQAIAAEVDSFFNYFYDNLGFIDKGFSCIDRYYLNLYIFSRSLDGSLYTVNPSPIGYMSIHPFWFRNNTTYFGGVAHELAHTFQGAAVIDGTPSMAGGTISEMCAQFMIASYYGDWPLREPNHITGFMQNSHLAFIHPQNNYHAPWVFEYWAQRHGRDIMGRLWRHNGGSDPVVRYKDMMGMDQTAFVDEMFDAVRHFPTWDLGANPAFDRFRDAHPFEVTPLGNGTYRPVASRYPQGYGYNAVRLNLPIGADRRITVEFEGIADDMTATNSRRGLMDWRYGLVAGMNDGTTVYSRPYRGSDSRAMWEVPAGARSLWLVVMGAPTEHYTTDPTGPCCTDTFPWQVRLTGTGVRGYATLPLDRDLAAGIGSVVADSNDTAAPEYYDLTGRRINGRGRGVIIEKRQGEAAKLIVR